MLFLSLRDSLVRFLNWRKHRDKPSNSSYGKREQNRLIHRLNCIQLDDDEAKCLQGYLTSILEERNHNQTSGTNGIVLEMGDEEFQDFAYHLGSDRIRLLRVLVQNGNSQTQAPKLAILSDHGIRLFHVRVQSANTVLRKSAAER